MSGNENSLMSHLASRTVSSYAQKSILAFGSRYDLHCLSRNPSLTPEVWMALASVKNDVVLTCNLTNYHQRLSQEQLRILAKDKRLEPRRALLRNALTEVDKELGEEILSAKHPLPQKEAAREWLRSGKLPDYMLNALVNADLSRFSLPHLVREDLFTGQEVLEILSKLKDTKLASIQLWGLLDKRPTLIPALTNSQDKYIVEALAGSRHIFDQSYFEKTFEYAKQLEIDEKSRLTSWSIFTDLLANPNVSPTLKRDVRKLVYLASSPLRLIANKVSNEGKFEGIIKTYDHQHNHNAVIFYTTPWEDNLEEVKEFFRTTAYMGNFFTRNRYPTLAEKKLNDALPQSTEPPPMGPGNPNLPAPKTLAGVLLSEAGAPKTFITNTQLSDEIEPTLDAIGQGAWDQFFALSVAWHGSVADLLEMVTNLS